MSCRKALDARLLAHRLRPRLELARVDQLDRPACTRIAARGAREGLAQAPFRVRGPAAVERAVGAPQEVDERRHAGRDNRTLGRLLAPTNHLPSGATVD